MCQIVGSYGTCVFFELCWAYVGHTLGQVGPLVHVGLLGAVLEPS